LVEIVDTSAVAASPFLDVAFAVAFDDKNVPSLPEDFLAASEARSASLFICLNSGEGKVDALEVNEEGSEIVLEFKN